MRTYLAIMAALLAADVAQAQDLAKPSAGLAASKVFAVPDMPATRSPSGAERRDVVRAGILATGEALEIHQSVQPPNAGGRPHAIAHSEIILVQDGTLALEHDGKSESAGPGSVIYVALGTSHLVRNVGTTPARYTVIAIGGDAK